MDIIYRFDPADMEASRPPESAEQAVRFLEEGNRRYQNIVRRVQTEVVDAEDSDTVVIPNRPLSLGFALAPGQSPAQNPFAVFLGCADARAPVEVIFDQSLNRLFTVRVAGNVLGAECLGSIEYAVRNMPGGLRLVVVLGHTGCGAVGAAVSLYLNIDAYMSVVKSSSLRSIVDRILMVVRAADQSLHQVVGPDVSQDPGYRDALWEMSVYLNAALTASDLVRELQPASAEQPVKVVFGIYDLATQAVMATPGASNAFRSAPLTTEEYKDITRELAISIRDRGILARSGR